MRANTRAASALSLADEALYRGQRGSLAAAAIANSIFIETASPSAGATGTIVSASYTPKVSGKILIIADVSGACDAANRKVTFTLLTSPGFIFYTVDAAPGGDAAFTLNAAMSRMTTSSNFVVGTPIPITWSWSVVGGVGTFQPGSGQGGITILELL